MDKNVDAEKEKTPQEKYIKKWNYTKYQEEVR